jgi:tight adherence protein B
VLGFALGFAVFGFLPGLAVGAFAASLPIRTFRKRRDDRLAKAQEAWPRMIEEIRIQAASLGRSIPQALFEVGRRGPIELRPAFEAAHREWLLSTDFERTVAVLKERLADPTADAACETLLIAHELGGADLERRLEALAEDRRQDMQNRKDARARQAGARFARRFVLIVPMGMALVGLTIGTGRHAYQTPGGQIGVLIALGVIAFCWVWAGRLMRLPEERRVFAR